MLPEQVYEALAAVADETDPAQATWEELKPRVLELVGVASEEDDPVLYQVVATIEQTSDSEQRELLGNRDLLWQMVSQSAATVDPMPADVLAEPATGESSTPAEPYWDGERWLYPDAAADPRVPAESESGEPQAADGAAPTETPEEVATDIYNSVLAEMIAENPDIAKAIEDDPELARELYAIALEQAQ